MCDYLPLHIPGNCPTGPVKDAWESKKSARELLDAVARGEAKLTNDAPPPAAPVTNPVPPSGTATGTGTTVTVTSQPPVLTGWVCPVCRHGVSPFLSVCPCVSPAAYVPTSWTVPSVPVWTPPVWTVGATSTTTLPPKK